MKRVIFCLAIILCLIVSSHADCQRRQVKYCISQYVQELDRMPDISSHCQRLTDVVHCFWAENSDCTSGEVIRRWRGWVLMVATLEKFLDMCPIDDQQLQRFYSTLPDDCMSEVDKKCAKTLHLSCNSMFVDAVKANRRICDDGRDWLECYNNSVCDQQSAIVRYAKFVGEVVNNLVADCES
ncbi:hypothetical protein ACROYT_G006962 [Oculina patagonica]